MKSSKIIFKDLESVKSYAESFSLWLEVLQAGLFPRGSGKVRTESPDEKRSREEKVRWPDL